MSLWKSDDELFQLAHRELFTCVVGDVMDKIGLTHQFLPPSIRPLQPEMVIVGRAMPVLSGDVFSEKVEGSANPLSARSFGLMLQALDDLRPGEVYVNTGSSPRNAMWGEMMSTRASRLGGTRRDRERLCPRYAGHHIHEFPHLRVWIIRAGFGAAL